jgi:hypothetical protein
VTLVVKPIKLAASFSICYMLLVRPLLFLISFKIIYSSLVPLASSLDLALEQNRLVLESLAIIDDSKPKPFSGTSLNLLTLFPLIFL